MSYWLQISAGDGPDECGLAVSLLAEHIQKQADKLNSKYQILKVIPGDNKSCFKSVLLSFENSAEAFLEQWAGTIQWTCPSPFRKNHKRKNWFISVELIKPTVYEDFRDSDIKIEITKASGPGGQHVNKTESAVRVTHLPTGITASSSEERSQHMNKKLALARLKSLLDGFNSEQRESKEKEIWQTHKHLERGNPKKIFLGPKFLEKRL